MWRIKFRTRIKILLILNIALIALFLYFKSGGYIFDALYFGNSDSRTMEIGDKERTEDVVFDFKEESLRKYTFDNYENEEKSYSFPTRLFDVNENRNIESIESKDSLFNKVVFKQTQSNLYHKFVHLDLKGAPPKLEYLKSILPTLRAAGATGLLIEYEDMFPYTEELEIVKAGNSYSKKELQTFLTSAKSFDLEVIPLIQTFGHMEFILKLKEFRELREVDDYPDSICPSKEKSFQIIRLMIDQVLSLHLEVLDLKRVHIGCDEVYHIHRCSSCISKNITLRQTFVNHITRVADYIREKYSNLTPLIWDDMLRGFLPNELMNSGLGSIVQPVIWIYTNSITDLVPQRVWYYYTKTFSGIWIASAFKGASGATQMIPNLRKNYENNIAWLGFAANFKIPGSIQKYNFQGIVLTGWSRYEHFSVLCETLPVSIPSLLLNLLLINMFLGEVGHSYLKKNAIKTRENIETDLFQSWLNLLKCHNTKGLSVISVRKKKSDHLLGMEKKLQMCNYHGNRIYGDVLNLMELERVVIAYHVNTAYKANGFLYYNVDHMSIAKMHNVYALEKAKRYGKDLEKINKSFVQHLTEVFDESTINELLEYKVNPLKVIIERVTNASKIADDTKIWKNRPFL